MAVITLNGRPSGIIRNLDETGRAVDTPQTVVTHGASPRRRVPISINGKVQSGVVINGFEYPPCESGCVLYLPGMPGYGATIWDRSPYGNNGTITGATWVRLPSGLWVNSFITDDKITVTDAPSLRLATFTLLTWLYWDTTTAGEAQFISSKNVTHFELQIGALVTVGSIRAIPAGFGATNIDADNALVTGWHLIGLTYTGTDTYVLVDGVEKAHRDSIVGGDDLTADASNFTFGSRAAALYLNGKLALIRLSTPISATQIAQIYQSERHLFGV